MNVTITGPRSVGKSAVSKIVAKKLHLSYISSDEIGEKALKKQGGLDKAIKSGIIGKFIQKGSYNLIRGVYEKDNLIFDLSGGSVSSTKYPEASRLVRETAKNNSIVIGLIPSRDSEESEELLFEREKERPHFKNMDKKELLAKVKKNYRKFPPIFKEFCDVIIYTKDKTKEQIADEIVSIVKQNKKI